MGWEEEHTHREEGEHAARKQKGKRCQWAAAAAVCGRCKYDSLQTQLQYLIPPLVPFSPRRALPSPFLRSMLASPSSRPLTPQPSTINLHPSSAGSSRSRRSDLAALKRRPGLLWHLACGLRFCGDYFPSVLRFIHFCFLFLSSLPFGRVYVCWVGVYFFRRLGTRCD